MSKTTDPPAPVHDRLLDDHELAARLGLSRSSLAAMRCRRTLPIPWVRVGRLVRYRAIDVDAYINANTVTPAALSSSAT